MGTVEDSGELKGRLQVVKGRRRKGEVLGEPVCRDRHFPVEFQIILSNITPTRRRQTVSRDSRRGFQLI